MSHVDVADWLIVETLPNWEVDQKNKFSHFGLPERFSRIKDQFRAGDRLFAYVTRRSAFSDIREIIKDGIRRLPMGGDYELSLPYCIDTKPVLILPPEKWVSIHDVKDRLKMTSGQGHWGHVFRSAPRRISRSDAVLLTEVLGARSRG